MAIRIIEKPGSIRFAPSDGSRHEWWVVDGVQVMTSGPTGDQGLTLSARLRLREEVPIPPLEKALANAVLDDDLGAAFALSDDLQERRVRPDGFVRREELLRRIEELEARLKEAERRESRAAWGDLD